MYRFVDLTEAEKISRRQLLDRYSLIAQFSALIPLLIIQALFFYQFLYRWWRARTAADLEAPSSPYLKKIGLAGGPGHGRVSKWLNVRVWAWWAAEPVEVSGWDLGTKGQVVGAAVWFLWLLSLCFVQTGEDYLHFTKRFGIIAASQLPLHYLLAMKTPYSPLQLLTRCSHETLNTVHQLLGRIIIALLYLHVAFYLNFYVLSGLLLEKLPQGYIICGITGILSLTAIGTTALQPIRRRNYRIFYVVHVVLATALLPVLFFHVSHIRPFLYETAFIYVVSAVLRYINTQALTATLSIIPGTSLISLKIEPPRAKMPPFAHWHPGQHAYISLPGPAVTRTFRSNPFTASSLPASSGYPRQKPNFSHGLTFTARLLDGNTARLARHAQHSGPITLSLEGPYGVPTHPERLLRYARVLFIAGGVGATFVLPLYKRLLQDLSPSPGSSRRRRVCFVWVARSWSEVAWGFEGDDVYGNENAKTSSPSEREGWAERARVCLTREQDSTGRGRYAGDEHQADGDDGLADDDEGGIELQERKTLLAGEEKDDDPTSSASTASSGQGKHAGVPVFPGRPDIRRLVDRTFGYGETERVAVVVCGPKGLGQSVRQEVGRWVRRGREVWFWEERFAM